MKTLTEQLAKTCVCGNKECYGNILHKAFLMASSEERELEILALAYKDNVPQLNKMLDQWEITF